MSFGIEAGEDWLFGFLKRAAEKFELDVLSLDAKVKSSALAMLDPHVGDWTGKMSTWLMPGEPYDVQNVTSTAQWSIGGKFLQRTFTGQVPQQAVRGHLSHRSRRWRGAIRGGMDGLGDHGDDADEGRPRSATRRR